MTGENKTTKIAAKNWNPTLSLLAIASLNVHTAAKIHTKARVKIAIISNCESPSKKGNQAWNCWKSGSKAQLVVTIETLSWIGMLGKVVTISFAEVNPSQLYKIPDIFLKKQR